MASLEHLKILKQGAKAWNQWRKHNYKEHLKKKAKLIRVNLSEADLQGAYLSRTDLNRVNLKKAKLSMVDLSGANLNGANLSKASLGGADLSEASLAMANLDGVSLMGARLLRTDLSGANLSRAKLTGSTLIKVHFIETNLSNASFYKAKMIGTSFIDIDFSETEGLETVTHWGPSNISVNTIVKSKGTIPNIFLRGCGFSDVFIEHMQSLYSKEIEYYSCFISYSHLDKKFAKRLYDTLQDRGIRCWLDEHQLLPGDDIHDMIDQGIRIWDKVLLCCSEASLTSWWVDQELDKAIQKEEMLWKDRGKKIFTLIPLDLDGYVFKKWENGKKSIIMSRKIVDFKGWDKDIDKFEDKFEKVIQALRSDELKKEPEPKPKL